MGWDDKDKDNPWKPGGDKKPADLDAIMRDFQRKVAGIFGGNRDPGRGQNGRRSLNSGLLGIAAVIVVGIWALTGFYKVDAAERGIVLRFGQYTATTSPGLRWHLPWPIETVELVNTSVTERWPYQGSMLTRDENIVIVDLIVQYRRADPYAYMFSLRDPEDTLRDVTASAIREIIGKNDLDFILTEGRADVSAQTHDLLQNTLDSYGTGITVYEVNLQEANFPREVEGSVQDAVKAREDRERRILEAESYSNDILPRARGAAARQLQDAEAYRARAIADADGEADRFVAILAEYQKAPNVTRERLYIETLEEVLSNSTKVLIDTEGGNNLLYLPLDQLTRRRGGIGADGGSGPGVPLSNNATVRDSRERDLR
ncbi:FtsH protease activity modulator HflK [Candidatus Rariloculus sp.]|uniref:FtsH protease activity modulator HflK n=1 Tax=Candidatus Rariloculus sp. TaxID=3101265 RepID=UPI003D10E7B7